MDNNFSFQELADIYLTYGAAWTGSQPHLTTFAYIPEGILQRSLYLNK